MASQWPVRCSRSHFMPGPGLMPASNLIIKQRPQTASWARATPSFPCAMTCTGGPLNARWAADWRPFPPLPSWQCTATRPELWLASTLLRFPVCGDSLLCDVRPVWRPGHATSGAEAAMPRGPLQIDSGAEPTKCHVIPFTSAHVACQFCPSLLTSTRASTAPKNHHGLDIGEPVVHFSHWTAHAGIAHLTFHPCYQALSSCCCCVGASRWGTPPAAAVSAVCRSCPAPPVVPNPNPNQTTN